MLLMNFPELSRPRKLDPIVIAKIQIKRRERILRRQFSYIKDKRNVKYVATCSEKTVFPPKVISSLETVGNGLGRFVNVLKVENEWSESLYARHTTIHINRLTCC